MNMHVIAWADVETTGIMADRHDLLEIAVFLTDGNLNLLEEGGFHAVVRQDMSASFGKASEYVRNMHSATGLWDKLSTGTPVEDVDGALRSYLERFCGQQEARLAGNSVRLDANFIDYHLPRTSEWLHYRLLDVSSLSFEAELRGIPWFTKRSTHEARSDVLESIEELKYLRKKLYKEEE